MFLLIAPIVALLSSQAHAHGIVTKIIAGTSTYSGYNPNFQYMPTPPAVAGWSAPATQDRGPVNGDQVGNPDIICQRGATPGKAVAEVAAGDKVTVQWDQWADSHKGPMLDYLADCGADCTTVDKTQLKFFKIDGVGMTSTTGTPPRFADDDMIQANFSWTVTIPPSIKAGNYVLRHETIALHQAQAPGGAQLYPQCINLKVTGGGSDVPAGVLGTELYKSADPGLAFNIYKQFTSTSDYPVPGPPLYSGAVAPAGAAPTPAPKQKVAAGASAGSASGSNCLERRHVRDFQ